MFRRIFGSRLSVRSLVSLAAVIATGCPKQELAPLGPCTVSSTAQRVEQEGLSAVDLLFVIDNSGSMATEQLKLAEQLPRLVQVLTTGNRDLGRTPPAGGPRMFTPVSSLHLGVVSTNMGGLDEPPAVETVVGLSSCLGLGDDGLLLNSTAVAAEGVVANMDLEFPDYAAGETVLPPDAACADIDVPPIYQSYEVGEEPSPEEIAVAFSCISKLGVRGCPFEQQLEAMWKALAPSDSDDEFLEDTHGHGEPDGENAGFLRDESILAVIHVSDEEDCSITQEGKALFATTPEADAQFGPEINLRCGRFADREELIWPVDRYIEGLLSLKPNNPDRIIFAAIVGIPEQAVGRPLGDILNMPQMQFRPGLFGVLPQPSCQTMRGGRLEEAYPPRRFLRVAQGFGNEAVVFSICANDYGPALDTLIEKIANKLSGNCLPRRLRVDDQGRVPCDVYELLAEGEDECSEDRGHMGDPEERGFEVGARLEVRKACKMQQVPVVGDRPMSGMVGWYYDDFSQDVMSVCDEGEQQRIVFSFGDLPEGASATFECFQSVARVDPTARGFDAVNTNCRGNPNACRMRSDADYSLFCLEDTCQITCQSNPDCPPGWVCATAENAGNGPQYCQLPTCPTDQATIERQVEDG